MVDQVSGEGEQSAEPIELTAREIGVAVLLAPSGELSPRTAPWLQSALERHLADRGRVLVDLARLPILWAPAVEVFPLALATAGGWPAARLVLFGATRDAPAVRRVAPEVHVADTGEAAVELLAVRPGRLSRRAELPCVLEAPQWARIMAEHTCDDWGLRDTCAASEAIVAVSELVSNAVLHAGTVMDVSFTLASNGLCVAVRDYGTDEVLAVRPIAERQLGLQVVAGVSRGWGVRRHAEGKTVWAVIPAGGPG